MATFVKVSVQGRETHKPLDMSAGFLEIPRELFDKWFEVRYNSRNAPYHRFKGEKPEDVLRFLQELVEHNTGGMHNRRIPVGAGW
jgi:hypothetical protein